MGDNFFLALCSTFLTAYHGVPKLKTNFQTENNSVFVYQTQPILFFTLKSGHGLGVQSCALV